MKVTITVELAQAILNYLAAHPYKDTYQLINALQSEVGPQMNIPKSPEEKPEGKPEEKPVETPVKKK